MLSHEPSVKSVREKGDCLLELVQDVTLKDKIDKLQSDYQALCSAGQVRRHQKLNAERVYLLKKNRVLTPFSLSEKLEGWNGSVFFLLFRWHKDVFSVVVFFLILVIM